MNGGMMIQGIVRGLHDVFAALWAGGLLTMALVVMPTVKSMQVSAARGPAGGQAGGEPGASGNTGGPGRFMVLMQKRLRVVMTVAIIGVFATGLVLLRLTLAPSGGLDPRSLHGALLIAKIALSVVMLVLAIVRGARLRKLGDASGDPRASGTPLLFANAVLGLVVLLLSGVAAVA